MIRYDDDDYDDIDVIMGYLDDPEITDEIDGLIDEGAFMGVDFDDPELMGGFLKNLFKKIGNRIRARKASGTLPTVSVQSAKGTTQVGPTGVSYTSATPTAVSTIPTSATTSPAEMLKNPMVLAGIGIAAILLLKSKKSGGK